MGKVKEKSFHIQTSSENCELNFFTKATDHKAALIALIEKSQDFSMFGTADKEMVIKVIKL